MTARQPNCLQCGEPFAQTNVGRDRVVIAFHCIRCQPLMPSNVIAFPVSVTAGSTGGAVNRPTVGDSSLNLAGASAPVLLEWDDNRWG